MSKQELLKKYSSERTRVEEYTRVMGYQRCKECFNTGKKGEFNERVYFNCGSKCK